MPWDDDDDWDDGAPKEGRHTRDQANPGFWEQNKAPATIAMGILGLLIVVVVVLAVL